MVKFNCKKMKKTKEYTFRKVDWQDAKQVEELLLDGLDWLKNTKEGKKAVLQSEIALFLRVPNSRLSESKPRFCNNIKIEQLFQEIDSILEHRLVKPALNKRTSGNFTRFLLINRHSERYKEKQTVEHDASGSLVEAIKELNRDD